MSVQRSQVTIGTAIYSERKAEFIAILTAEFNAQLAADKANKPPVLA